MLAMLTIASCKSNKKVTDLSNTKDKKEETAKMEPTSTSKEESAARPEEVRVSLAEKQLTLSNYFNAIANASNANSANSSINEALTLFNSSTAPVIIIIHRDGSTVDYDKPTTIKEYLNYIKDQKKNANAIDKLVLDDSGKIKSVELIKIK